MSRLELDVEREIVGDPARVLELLDDPESYPDWVATLRSLEEGPRGAWTARAGYLGYERVLEFRRRPAPDATVSWRGQDGGFEAGLDVTARAHGTRRVTVHFQGFIEGSDRILGFRVDHELIALSLRLAAEHSLTQLERLADVHPPALAGSDTR